MEWENSVITMHMHKVLEYLEKLNKEDTLCSSDIHASAKATQSICNMLGIKQHWNK